LKGKCVLAYI